GGPSQRRLRSMSNASRVWFSGGLTTFVVVNGFLLSLEAGQQSPPGSTAPSAPAASHQAFVTRYCVSCHKTRAKRGGLTLAAVLPGEVGDSPEVWEKVGRKVRARQMPPIGLPRPDDAAYNAEVSLLETSLDRVAATAPNPGRTATLRRLTRTEY